MEAEFGNTVDLLMMSRKQLDAAQLALSVEKTKAKASKDAEIVELMEKLSIAEKKAEQA